MCQNTQHLNVFFEGPGPAGNQQSGKKGTQKVDNNNFTKKIMVLIDH